VRNIWRLLSLLAVVALPTVAAAQITVPFPSFTAGTTIQPDEVNTNFAKFGDALNRTGGTMTGTLTTRDVFPDTHNTRDLGLTGTRFRDAFFGRNVDVGGTFGATGAATFGSTLAATGAVTFSSTLAVTGTATLRDILPQTTATYDVGVTGTRWRDGWFSRNVDIGGTLGATGAVTFASTLAVNNTGATALDVAGGAQFGSGNVALIGTDGRLTALSSTTLANLSGANLTGLLEAHIADGAVFPRLAGAETVTGDWTWQNAAPRSVVYETDAPLNEKAWHVAAAAGDLYFQTWNDAGDANTDWMRVIRSGITASSVAITATATTVSGSLGVGGGTAVASIITGTTTWDPTIINNGSTRSVDVTVTGVQSSSPCFVGYAGLAGFATTVRLQAHYESANTVRVVIDNQTGSNLDFPSGTVRVTCFTY